MASKKQTRRALFMSVVSLMLCVAMLAGTTFAWFTDEVTSGNNTIAAGNLDVALYHSDKDAPNGEEVTGNTKLFDDVDPDLWEPGAVAYENFKVVNEGTLALKYRMSLKTLEQSEVNGYKLGDVIKVGFKQGGFTSTTREGVINEVSEWKSLTEYTLDKSGVELAAGASDEFGLVLYWQPNDNETDNHYNVPGKALYLNVGVELYATQVEAEEDSFGDDYDEFADLGEAWDGETKEEPKVDEETGVIHITNAAELVAMMEVTGNSIYSGKTIVLDADINLGGATIKGIGDDTTNFAGIFDGQGHAIGNFKIDASGRSYYAGLFNQVSHGGTVKNLTVKGATVIGTSMVGAVASSVDSGTVTNCKAIDCTLMGVKKVGSVIGYSAGGTVTNNYAENCTIYYSEKEAGEVLGFENTGSTVTGNTAKNITIQCRVSNADELAKAVANGATDIELNDGEYNVYDCAGKTLTISGSKNAVLKVMNEGEDGCDYGFGGGSAGIGNITFNGVTIDTTSNTGNYKGYAYMKGTFNNCTFVGAYSLNNGNDFEFNNCSFDFKNGYFWTWAAKSVTFNGCNFSGNSKTILAHGSASTQITINNCTFAATEKGYTGSGDWTAAVEMDPTASNTYTVNITGSSINKNYSGWTRVKDTSTGHVVTIDGNELVSDGLTKDAEGEYYVYNANGLEKLNAMMADKSAGKNTVVNLTDDIDFAGKTWTPVDSHADTTFTLTEINGNGHTISNLTVNGQAMFTRFAGSGNVTIKDITFDGAVVNSNGKINTSILTVQSYQNVLLDNVDVKNSSITGGYKVAPLIGTVYNESSSAVTATLKNCDVNNVVVTATSYDLCTAGMVAFVYEGDNDKIEFENCTVSNVQLKAKPNGYASHAWIYVNDAETDDCFNEANGVTVTNCTFEAI